jgi:hypothetical protein
MNKVIGVAIIAFGLIALLYWALTRSNTNPVKLTPPLNSPPSQLSANKKTQPNPISQGQNSSFTQRGNSNTPHTNTSQTDFKDDDLEEAIRRSLEDTGPNSGSKNHKNFVKNSQPPSANIQDDDLQQALKQSKEEAEKKEKEELEQAQKASQKQITHARQNATPPPKNPISAAKTSPQKQPPSKKPGDAVLQDTALPVSDMSDQALNLAVENAKKLNIKGHEIKRNNVGNAYLVLEFENSFHLNRTIQALKADHAMFQAPSTPNVVDEIKLELTVDQTIDFQNKF